MWTGAWIGWITGGGTIGLLLSNKLSGTRETAYTMVVLEYASFPDLSNVSKIVNVGNILNTWTLYPGNFDTGLFIKSNCKSCLKFLSGFKC